MAITQQVDNLLGGVSQAPPEMRDPSQATEQINMLSHRSRGLRRRPPTEHKALISSSLTGIDALYTAELHRSATERYRVVILNGDLHVYDALTGASQTVLFPHGKSYLTTITRGFRHILTGDQFVVLNRSETAARDAASSASTTVPQALLVVRAVKLEGTYKITLDGAVHTLAATVGSTDALAASFAAELTGAPNCTVQHEGAVVHLKHTDGTDFTIVVEDGQDGNSVLLVKDTVQAFDQLPLKALGNPLVEVIGDPSTAADNFYVQYDPVKDVWTECLKPGLFAKFDAASMPHVLAYGGNIIDETPNQLPAVLPVVRDGIAPSTTPQAFTNVNGTGADDGDHDIFEEASYLQVELDNTDGTARTITLRYDVDTTQLTDDISVSVTGYIDTGTSTSFVAQVTKSYVAGAVYPDETIIFTASPIATTSVRLGLNYSTGSTPTGGEAELTGHGAANAHGAGVTSEQQLATDIVFDTFTFYPGGTTYTLTLNGAAYFYTVGTYTSGADETGESLAINIALALAPGAPPGGGWPPLTPFVAVTAPGTLSVYTAGGTTATVVVTSDFDAATDFYNSTLSLEAAAYVGYTLKNVSDSSSGTITGNTARTITVGSLTGGTKNSFSNGDVCTVVGTGTYFIFREAAWTIRAAGDDTSAPFPSFIDRQLDEVFFYQNRLGFTARDAIVLSQSGAEFNFFRQSAAQLLADDVIDVKAASRVVGQFVGAVPWTDGLYLASDDEIFRLSGEPALTPQSVRLDPLGGYLSAPGVRPLAIGGRLFLAGVRNGYTRVNAATILSSATGESVLQSEDITAHVPAYIPGSPLSFVADSEADMLFVLTDEDEAGTRRNCYVCNYDITARGVEQAAWHTWTMPEGSSIIAIDALSGALSLLIVHGTALYLETLTLDPAEYIPPLLGDGSGFGDGTFYGSGLTA